MTLTAVELESWSKEKKKHNSLLFPRLPLISWPSVTQRPHQSCSALLLHRDHQASPFTFSWNDLPSTFLLASAFIHIWGSQRSSFNNSARIGGNLRRGPRPDWAYPRQEQVHGYEKWTLVLDILALSPLLCNLMKLFACNKSTSSSPPQLVWCLKHICWSGLCRRRLLSSVLNQ